MAEKNKDFWGGDEVFFNYELQWESYTHIGCRSRMGEAHRGGELLDD